MANLIEPMKRALNSKYREYIRETCAEYQRRGNYIRIYPAKGSDMYDHFFSGPRPYNKAVYKALFTDEILKTGPQKAESIPKQMNFESKDPQQSAYDKYQKQQQEKADLKK